MARFSYLILAKSRALIHLREGKKIPDLLLQKIMVGPKFLFVLRRRGNLKSLFWQRIGNMST